MFETARPDERTGSLVKSAQVQPSQQGSVVYLNIEDDLDACLTRVTAAGGAVAQGKTALPPEFGSFAHISGH
jgi:predicted enzyme related to lactoylglutathione lyase